MTDKKSYESPRLVGYGSIADRTLGRSTDACDDREPGTGTLCPPKDINACENDKYGEWSCSS